MNGFIKLLVYLFLVMLVFVPVHTKLASVAWGAFILVILLLLFQSTKQSTEQIIQTNLNSITFFWLAFSIVAYFIRLAVQTYHGEFNYASNFNAKVLIIALLVHLAIKKIGYNEAEKYNLHYLSIVLLGIGFSSLFMALPLGKNITFGTNQIPWAAGVSILSCVLQVSMLQRIEKFWYQIFGWVSLIFIAIAIFIYGVRGSYFYIIWLPCFAISYMFFLNKHKRITRYWFLSILFISFILCYLCYLNFSQTGLSKIYMAYFEIKNFIISPERGANSSVGARLYMWINSLQYFYENPILGLSKAKVIEMINKFALTANAGIMLGLNHLHNEYLQALLSYGIIGLFSFLLYPLGVFFIGFKLRKFHPQASIGLFGMFFLFITASMTNTNTYHNYFSTLFSLSIGLVFVVCRLKEIRTNSKTINSKICPKIEEYNRKSK